LKLHTGIGIALRGINHNRLRGFLSILGVIIGVVAVIGMGALAASMQQALASQAQQLGANTFTVERMNPIEMATIFASGNRQSLIELWRRPRLELRFVDEIRENCPSVRSVAAFSKGSHHFRHRGHRSDQSMSVLGTNEDFLQGGIYELKEGRFLLSNDIKSKRYVCVIGQEIVREFFEGVDPIGKDVNVGPMPCKVIGTLEEVGSTMGENPDQVAIIPVTTAFRHWPWMIRDLGFNIEAYPDKMNEAQDEVITVLRRLRGLRPWEENNFSITTSQMMAELFGQATAAAAFVVLLIAGVSLIVAGIGIMNVMFVSVRERTREIGIRKACGASSPSIMLQFTLEAVLLSSIGGILGMVIIGISMAALGGVVPFDLVFPSTLILIGLAFSIAVGVIFGIIPAYRASKLNVVDALRYE